MSPTSSQACTPKQAQPSAVQPTARAIPPTLSGFSSAGRRIIRSARSRPNFRTTRLSRATARTITTHPGCALSVGSSSRWSKVTLVVPSNFVQSCTVVSGTTSISPDSAAAPSAGLLIFISSRTPPIA